MSECIFCRIIKWEIPCTKIYEDEEFLAILDINPNSEGMTLVLTKKHYPAYVFDMPDEVYKKFMLVSKKIAKTIDKALNVKRTAMVMEGMGINHAHIKLYPLHGLKETFTEMWHPEKVFFKKYEGYITTQLGPEAKKEELEKTAKKIKSLL